MSPSHFSLYFRNLFRCVDYTDG